MNQIERGKIRQVRGTPYENQFNNNFTSYWKELDFQTKQNPI